jgi:pyrroline-5-carboxylate reductase
LYKFGVIGGTGWMGSAMLKPALTQSLLESDEVAVANHDGAVLAGFPEVVVFSDPQQMAQQSACVVLSVRPEHFPQLELDLKDTLVISIMAGVAVEKITEATGAKRVIRAMPNAAAEVAGSYTPYFATDAVTAEEIASAEAFFNGFGSCDRLGKEDDINYMVALTGSGHGTLAFFASSLIKAGVEHGIDSVIAEKGVRQLMQGMGQLVAQEENSPEATVERVTTYGGTTCRLVQTLAEEGVDSGIAAALQAAYLRATSDMTKQQG